MTREVVRNLRSEQTHLADIDRSSGAVIFGKPYRKPPVDTQALCGVKISDGVVMREGTKTKCRACLHIGSKT